MHQVSFFSEKKNQLVALKDSSSAAERCPALPDQPPSDDAVTAGSTAELLDPGIHFSGTCLSHWGSDVAFSQPTNSKPASCSWLSVLTYHSHRIDATHSKGLAYVTVLDQAQLDNNALLYFTFTFRQEVSNIHIVSDWVGQ